MSTNIEVSEGLPLDGRIFEPPVSNVDREAPRYLAFLGSLVEPQTATNRPWTKGGGIEVANPCLRFVKNFLRKGRITPLLKDTHNYILYDVASKIVDGDPTQHGYFRQPIPAGYVAPEGSKPRGNGLVGRLAYPGDQINWILTGNTNIYKGRSRGIVELKSLESVPYRPQTLQNGLFVDPEIWKMQLAIFPNYPNLPILLDDIERLLDDAAQHTFIRAIVDDFTRSLTQFRNYASTTIQNSHIKMREIGAKTEGYIPEYTEVDLVLLEQLGMERQDRAIRTAVSATPNTGLESMFQQFMALQIEEKQLNLEGMKRTGEAVAPDEGYGGQSGYSGYSGEVVAETMAAAAPIPVEPEVFTCEHCGDEVKNSARGIHLSRWCTALHPRKAADDKE